MPPVPTGGSGFPDLGDLIALYAAVVATIVAYLQYRKWRDDRPRFKVEASRGLHGKGHVGGQDRQRELIELLATNMGTQPLRLTELGFLIEPGDRFPIAFDGDPT